MQGPKSIPSFQLIASLGTSIIGVGLLSFPRIAVEYTDTAAPLTTLAAVILMTSVGVIVAYLGAKYPEDTIFSYGDLLIGKWFSGLLTTLLSIYYLILAGLTAREFGEVVVTSVLQRTPIPVTVLVMLILAAIAARNDIAVFSRILTFYMPFVYVPALVIVLTSLKNAEAGNLRPILAGVAGVPVGNLFLSILIVAALLQNFLVLGLLIPFMYRPAQAIKSTLIGMGTAGALYVILICSTISVFGIEEMKKLLWPTLELAKTAAVPTFYIERLDPIFLAVWVTAVFCTLLTSYYIGIQGFGHVLGLRDHRVLTLPALPLLLLIAKLPGNIFSLYRIVEIMGMSGLGLTVGFPLLLFLVHLLKGRSKIPGKQRERVA